MADAALQALLDADGLGTGLRLLRRVDSADGLISSYYVTSNGAISAGHAQWVDVAASNSDAQKNLVIRASMTLGMSLIRTPTGFGWAHPYTFIRSPTGISTTFDITSKIPAITNTWYVDPVNGNDGTAVVNTRGSPLKNLSTALAKNPCDQVRIINLAADFIARTTAGWNNVQPAVSMSVIVEGSFRFISAKVVSATIPTWVLQSGTTYSTASLAATPGAIIDTNVSAYQTYLDQTGSTITLSNVPKAFSTYTAATSLAQVNSTAGSWWFDSAGASGPANTLYVRAVDDRSLVGDTKLIPTTSGNNGRFGAATNGLTLYVGGNLDFVGGSTPFLALTASAANTGNLYFGAGVSFQGSQSAANGLSVQGLLDVALYRCGGYNNKADDFNYHSFEADGTTAGTSPTWFENECCGIAGGKNATPASNNASTSHDFCVGIRLNCAYPNSADRVTAETNSAQCWMMGCVVGQGTNVQAGGESIAALLSSKVWLDTCTALAGSNSRWIAAQTATLSHSNSGPVANAGTGEATGTVQPYVA